MQLHVLERRLNQVLEAALAAGLLAVFLLIVVLVAMRYALGAGLVGANETATVVFVHLSALGSAVAVGRQEHIRVDLLSARVGPRGKLALNLTTLALVGLLNLALLAFSVPWIAKTGYVPMPATQVPRYVAQVAVPLGSCLAALYCGIRIATLLGKERAS